jgi:hypothetical protein
MRRGGQTPDDERLWRREWGSMSDYVYVPPEGLAVRIVRGFNGSTEVVGGRRDGDIVTVGGGVWRRRR